MPNEVGGAGGPFSPRPWHSSTRGLRDSGWAPLRTDAVPPGGCPAGRPTHPSHNLPPPRAAASVSRERAAKGRSSPQPYLGSAGRGRGRRRHRGAAVVALAGAGAGARWGGRPGGRFGPSAPRAERRHSLRGALRQDELLPELEVGPSSCWRDTERRAEGCGEAALGRDQGGSSLPRPQRASGCLSAAPALLPTISWHGLSL